MNQNNIQEDDEPEDRNEIGGLALSYDNQSIVDGAGSQLHRIYSIYALSRFLGVPYIHTPIQEIPYQGLLSLEKNEVNLELVSRYNHLFSIPSDCTPPLNVKVQRIFGLETDLSFLFSLKEELKKSKESYLLKIGWPFFLVNQSPNMFHHVKKISPFEKTLSFLFKIVIHVRRGDLLIAPEGERMLPNSYYVTLALQVIQVLEQLGISFICELHTEIPSKIFTVTHDHDGIKKGKIKVKTPITLRPENYSINDFEVIPYLKKYINHDPIETLRSMATADLLIMSRSSFSYLAAILNKKGIIVYHPFWFATPLEWLDATHHPSFPERLMAACQQWKKDHQT